MVAIAHGNDMGGSIRFPAAWCGLVGLKPTRARTSLAPTFGEYWGPLTHEHVLTRTVRDTAAALDVLAGPAPGDPYTAPAPARPWRDEVGADPGRLRIAFRAASLDAEVTATMESTGALLSELGHEVRETAMPALDDPTLLQGFGVIVCAAIARDLDRWSAVLGRHLTEEDVEPSNWMLATLGRAASAAGYLEAVEQMQGAARRIAAAWHGDDAIDVLVTPTVPEPALELGRIDQEGRSLELVQYTVPFNATGQPAVSLPLGWTESGLPIGVQLVADSGREDVLIRLAAQLEQARPWADRHPPIS
jgi:amidase